MRFCSIHNREFVLWPIKLPAGYQTSVEVCVKCQDEKEAQMRKNIEARAAKEQE